MNCSACGNTVADFTKGCSTCGHYANSSTNFCFNCGRQNAENYNICAGCKSPLVARQNSIVATLLSFFVLFPFLALYARRWKEAILRITIALIGVLCLPITLESGGKESVAIALGSLMTVSWGFLFFWSVVDMMRVLFLWPKPYTNSEGHIIK